MAIAPIHTGNTSARRISNPVKDNTVDAAAEDGGEAGKAAIFYSMHTPEGSLTGESDAVEVVLNGVESAVQRVLVERETGFEPATACLEGRNSTAELLPLAVIQRIHSILAFGSTNQAAGPRASCTSA